MKVGDLVKPFGDFHEHKVGVVAEIYDDTTYATGMGPIFIRWFDEPEGTFTYANFVEVISEAR